MRVTLQVKLASADFSFNSHVDDWKESKVQRQLIGM